MINHSEMTLTWVFSYLVGTLVAIAVFVYLMRTRPKPYLSTWLIYFGLLHIAYWMVFLTVQFAVSWALGLFSIFLITAGYVFWLAVRRFFDLPIYRRYHVVPVLMLVLLTVLSSFGDSSIVPVVMLHAFSGVFYGIAGFEVLNSPNRNERFIAVAFFAFSILVVFYPLIMQLNIPSFYAMLGLTLSGFLFTVSALFLVLMRTIEEDIASRAELYILSNTDPLTGLYNRRYLSEKVEELNAKTTLPVAIIMADLNHLKHANDSGGHLLGDALLLAFANLLRDWLPADAFITRYGGDEFVVLLQNTTFEQATVHIKQLHHVASQKMVGNYSLDVAIGVAIKTTAEEPFDAVFARADDAMYKNKPHKSERTKTIL